MQLIIVDMLTVKTRNYQVCKHSGKSVVCKPHGHFYDNFKAILCACALIFFLKQEQSCPLPSTCLSVAVLL